MQARDVMSHPVISVRPHVRADAAAALLVSRGFTAAPVVTAEGVLVGIVSEADLLHDAVGVGEPSAVPDHRNPPVSEVMTPAPVAVRPDADVTEVAAIMLGAGLRAVPVLDGGHLVGIVTRRDILRRVAAGEFARRGDVSRTAW